MHILSITAKQALLEGETDAEKIQVGQAEVMHRVLCPVPQIALHPGSTNILGDLFECQGWSSYNYGLSVWLEIEQVLLNLRKCMFTGKILVSHKHKEVTLRHEELPAHSTLTTDAQGAQQLATQLLHVGVSFHTQHSSHVLSLPHFPGGICSIQKATLTL